MAPKTKKSAPRRKSAPRSASPKHKKSASPKGKKAAAPRKGPKQLSEYNKFVRAFAKTYKGPSGGMMAAAGKKWKVAKLQGGGWAADLATSVGMSPERQAQASAMYKKAAATAKSAAGSAMKVAGAAGSIAYKAAGAAADVVLSPY